MEELKTSLREAGLSPKEADKMAAMTAAFLKTLSPEESFQKMMKEALHAKIPFSAQLSLYKAIFPNWEKMPAPAWLPDETLIKNSNLGKLMAEKGYTKLTQDYSAFHRWTVEHYPDYWRKMCSLLNIQFDTPYTHVVDLSHGIEKPHWFPEAKLNIANSCFQQVKRKELALIFQTEQGKIHKLSYEELDRESNRIANSLLKQAKTGDRIGLIMPMTIEAVALYLGIVKAGCVVVPIPDSFSAKEIETRLKMVEVSLVFCQDQVVRGGKVLPLYERIKDIPSLKYIILPANENVLTPGRPDDLHWKDFLSTEAEDAFFTSITCSPQDPITILFSSGTSGLPKAIPWDHTTPIKCGADAYLHHNVQATDVFCWPSNLGWMMGPWLLFACLMNRATVALYSGVPFGKNFGKFIQQAKVTHLGVVPTLVRNWRTSRCMEGLAWKNIKLFTSTGERSNIDDMLYLMSLAHYKPVIEYCGGTEIGGAYLTGTLLQGAAPAAFTTPALGLDFVLLNEEGQLADRGEIALIPPSLGLSTELIKQDHHEVYYDKMPKALGDKVLRRHGDQIERFPNGYYRLLGRVDDVMNLGGIKISSAELESCLQSHPLVYDSAAVSVDFQNELTQLIVFVVLKQNVNITPAQLKEDFQKEIRERLNPLFKIEEVVVVPYLPRTPSNKILRRVLRDNYRKMKHSSH